MTPKEKANELISKYAIKLPTKYNNIVDEVKIWDYNVILAKQCALIAVNEIILQWEYIDTYLSDLGGELNPNLKYWYEVKQEIEKL